MFFGIFKKIIIWTFLSLNVVTALFAETGRSQDSCAPAFNPYLNMEIRAFMQAIREQPRDWANIGVWADRILDADIEDYERARFLAGAHRLREADPSLPKLSLREKAMLKGELFKLYDKNIHKWSLDVAKIAGEDVPSFEDLLENDGFTAKHELHPRTLLAHPALLSMDALHLNLNIWSENGENLAEALDLPGVENFVALAINARTSSNGYSFYDFGPEVLKSPKLKNIKSLTILRSRRAILEEPNSKDFPLANLEELSLQDVNAGDLSPLASQDFAFKKLKSLKILGMNFSYTEDRNFAVFSSPNFQLKNLQKLHLDFLQTLSVEQFSQIAGPDSQLQNLTHILLQFAGLNDQHIAILTSSASPLVNLEFIDVSLNSQITAHGRAMLKSWQARKNGREFKVGW